MKVFQNNNVRDLELDSNSQNLNDLVNQICRYIAEQIDEVELTKCIHKAIENKAVIDMDQIAILYLYQILYTARSNDLIEVDISPIVKLIQAKLTPKYLQIKESLDDVIFIGYYLINCNSEYSDKNCQTYLILIINRIYDYIKTQQIYDIYTLMNCYELALKCSEQFIYSYLSNQIKEEIKIILNKLTLSEKELYIISLFITENKKSEEDEISIWLKTVYYYSKNKSYDIPFRSTSN